MNKSSFLLFSTTYVTRITHTDVIGDAMDQRQLMQILLSSNETCENHCALTSSPNALTLFQLGRNNFYHRNSISHDKA